MQEREARGSGKSWVARDRKTRHSGHCYRPLNTTHTQARGWGEPRVTEATAVRGRRPGLVLSGTQAAVIRGTGLGEARLLVEAPQLCQQLLDEVLRTG